NDETVREQCKGLIALSFMPVSEVEQQFNRIRALALPSLEELFIYFERQWIKGNIPLVLWNSSQCSPRTNNISEGMKEHIIKLKRFKYFLVYEF
ncbi:unnamed protein product, partial [Rotaria socialis]